MVSMVVTLLSSVVTQSIDAGGWLGSLSAYYFTPAHAIFIGSLVTIGVCLVAIRGVTNPEDIALNLAGLSAPLVAFVPTGFPDGSVGHENLFPKTLPISSMQLNNVVALVVTAVFAVVLSFVLGTRGDLRKLKDAFPSETVIGFGLAAFLIGGYLVVHGVWGSQGVHNMSAGALIGGLWFVATLNAVRRLTDESGHRPWGLHLAVGAAGSVFVLGSTLSVVGLARVVSGDSVVLLVVGLLLTVAVVAFARRPARLFFSPPADQRGRFERWYVLVAVLMVVGGPLLGLWPGEFAQRTLFVELAELLPFGLFWVVQTIEYWDASVEEVIAAA